jgi:S1-C subfamily serine protease
MTRALIIALITSLTFLACNRPEAAAPKLTIDQLAERVRQNAFYVWDPKMRASAVFLKPGIALTAKHVCGGMTQLTRLVDYKDVQYRVVEIVMDTRVDMDLCMVYFARASKEAPVTELPGTPLNFPHRSVIGTKGFTGGFGGGEFYSFISGVFFMSGKTHVYGAEAPLTEDFFSFQVEPGASGSGVVDEEGNLIGIVSVAGQGSTGAIPLWAIKEFLRKNKVLPDAGT